MTKGNQKLLCEENLRHAEYYSMLSVFDDLYEKSKSGVVFEDLMPLILDHVHTIGNKGISGIMESCR